MDFKKECVLFSSECECVASSSESSWEGSSGKRGVCFKGGEASNGRTEKRLRIGSERLGELAPCKVKRKMDGDG